MGDNGIRQVALERCVLILGAASLQNKLLAKLITDRTGYACEIRDPERQNGFVPSTMLLVLLDAADCGSRMPALCASGLFPSIAVINADTSVDWTEFVAYPGVKGVFRSDVTEDQLIKGIHAMFDGEYWLTRKLLWSHLERTRTMREATESPLSSVLTRKEMQTLKLLATGNSTDSIATALKVSPHTVKTHIYNLFRKIHVSNRVQAVHWAARNMVITGLGSKS